MSIRDLLPRRREAQMTARRGDFDALDNFHREIDRLFAGWFADLGFDLPARGEAFGALTEWPRVNIAESDNEVIVTAELPGLDEKSVKVELDDEAITLQGEVCDEREDKNRRWTRFERRCGSFQRTLALPAEVRADKAKATFKRGLLTVTLPKRAPSAARRRSVTIEVEK
jgi:HSP20 family protein